MASEATDTLRAAIIAALKRRGAIDDLDVTPSLTLLGSRTSTASVVLYGPDGVVIDVVARAGDDAKALRGVAFACGLRDDGGDPAEEVERLREERQGLREDVAYVGASCDRELTIDGVALRAARLSPTRHDVERLTRERDEAIALESGRLVLHKAADDLLNDPDIERLFLGGAHAAAPSPA